MSLVKWFGPTNSLVMAPNSPKLSMTDRVRETVIYMGQQSYLAGNVIARGTFGSGMYAGFVCNQCVLDTSRGDVGTLTIDWEAGGASATQPLPSGSYSLKPQELYPKIERAACFQGITAATINAADNYIHSALNSSGSQIVSSSSLSTWVTDPTQLTLANNLVSKWLKGEETFYLAGWRYTYEVFSYTAPTINRGGVPGSPGGPLYSSLPSGVSWLRLADDLEPAGTPGSMYKLTVTWLGGPIYGGVGYWDTDVYV